MDFIVEREKNKKQKKRYFTQETEDAIIAYNLESDPDVKNKIYQEKILFLIFHPCLLHNIACLITNLEYHVNSFLM